MKPEPTYERIQRRVFGVLVPVFLAFLLVLDTTDANGLSSPYTPILLVLLVSYGSGLTAYVLKRLIGKTNGSDDQEN